MDVGAIYDHSFLGKANVGVEPSRSIVTLSFGGSSIITIILANVPLVNCQLSWRGRKCATASVFGTISKIQAGKRMGGYVVNE